MVEQFPPIIATATAMQSTLQTIHSSFDGLIVQMQQMTDTATAMGEAFDASKSDDYFYLPPEVFPTPTSRRVSSCSCPRTVKRPGSSSPAM